MKYIFFTFILMVFPAIAQEPQQVKSDTTRLFKELQQLREEKKEIVDSMKVLAVRIDSTKEEVPPAAGKKSIDYQERYNVDKVNGERVTWYFNYHIRGTDTIFLCVTKKYSRWDY